LTTLKFTPDSPTVEIETTDERVIAWLKTARAESVEQEDDIAWFRIPASGLKLELFAGLVNGVPLTPQVSFDRFVEPAAVS
jgi:hypothetical protein